MRKLLALLVLLVIATGVRADEDSLRVVRVASGAGVHAVAARVATGPADKLYVAWAQQGPVTSRGMDVMASSSLAGGDAWSKPERVSDDRSTAWAGYGEGPSLVVDRLGYVYVSWTDQRKGLKDADIYFARSGATVAEAFTPPVRVNDDGGAASQCFQSLAVDETGQIYVAWLDERVDRPALYVGRSKNGERFENLEASRGFPGEPCDCCRPALTADGAGRLYAAYRNNIRNTRDIHVTWSEDRAASFTTPVLVSPDRWRIESCPMAGPAVAVDFRRRPLVFWWTGGAALLQVAGSDNGGRSFGSPVWTKRPAIATNHPAMAARDASVVIAWEDHTDAGPVVRAAVSDDSGQSFRALRLGPREAAPGRFPSVALDSRRHPIVGWTGVDSDPAVFVALP